MQRPGFQNSFQVGQTAFVILDSSLEGTSAGRVDGLQLRWLVQQLSGSQGPAVVCVHHHFLPTGLAWLDRLKLQNGDDFAAILQAHPALQLVLFGHIHRAFEGTIGTATLLGTPSTGYQFAPRSESREISEEPLAYRIVTLEDGQVASELRWLSGPEDTKQD